ncbi:MAG: hypothetical protein FWD75_11220 [Propionibacteriaceae bacterium]|nr:hypothetical protein [Propionibacteriaceae bacterium]
MMRSRGFAVVVLGLALAGCTVSPHDEPVVSPSLTPELQACLTPALVLTQMGEQTMAFTGVRVRHVTTESDGGLGELVRYQPVENILTWDPDSTWAADDEGVHRLEAENGLLPGLVDPSDVDHLVRGGLYPGTFVLYVGQEMRTWDVYVTCSDGRHAHGLATVSWASAGGTVACDDPIAILNIEPGSVGALARDEFCPSGA